MARRKTMDEKIPAFTPKNLRRGIKEFIKTYSDDFHASLYCDLRDMHSFMFTPEWWEKIYQTNKSGSLTKWRATRRAQNDPYKAGLRRLEEMRSAYSDIPRNVKKFGFDSPKCTDAVAELFCVAQKIKKTKHKSAVFADKLCHFILPNAFPVLDGKLSNILQVWGQPTESDYWDYWDVCRCRWRKCDKESLEKILHMEILRTDSKADFDNYPWAAKIAELCAWGARN